MEAKKATDYGFLCDRPCTRYHMHGDCYCTEHMRHRAHDLDDAVFQELHKQGWWNLRKFLRVPADNAEE